MQVSEALEAVNKLYVPGVVKFYAELPVDHWQEAHDTLEGQMVLYRDAPDYFERMERAAEQFVSTCARLVEAYKLCNEGKKAQPSIADDFHMGDEHRVKDAVSRAERKCLSCGTGENVRACFSRSLQKHGLFCTQCVGVC